MRLRTAPLLVGSALLLSACGLRGDLERPAPLWGDADPTAATDDVNEEAPEDPDAPLPIDPPDAR
ncbi:lipoprotein [Brevundimonas sp.]|uniref:LPS translocon maturation chaperone LptM n=1 Tax=Brevundimonas sp. TaxID=1871086 RepID=UPI0025F05A2A|nr:lipoprotein [Brevundimonas sp.]